MGRHFINTDIFLLLFYQITIEHNSIYEFEGDKYSASHDKLVKYSRKKERKKITGTKETVAEY